MAKMRVNGMDVLDRTYEELSDLGRDAYYRILDAGGEVLKAALTEKIKTIFNQHTGILASSIQMWHKAFLNIDGTVSVLVGPEGKHGDKKTRRRRSRAKTVEGQRNHKHRRENHSVFESTNAEIAYVLEYGSARITARHWMEETLDENEDAIYEAMAAAWDAILDEKGL